MHLGFTGPRQGLLKTAFKGPVSVAAARYCSEDAVAFAAGSLDLPAVVDAFQALADALPEQAGREVRRGLLREMQRELRQIGMTPEALDQLLRSFGNNMAVAVDLQKGPTPLPEVLLFAEVKDFERVAPLLARMEQASAEEAGVEWKTRKAGDSEIRYCNVNVGVAISPCWVRHEGMLIFSSHVRSLVSALGRVQKGEGSLAGTADFRDMAQGCGDASLLVHLRLKTGAEVGWQAVEGMLRGLVDRNADMLGFSGDVVPETGQVAVAAGTMTFSVHVDDQGLLLRQHGTLAFGAALASVGRLADEVLERASAKVY
jgi:hypothetical protein